MNEQQAEKILKAGEMMFYARLAKSIATPLRQIRTMALVSAVAYGWYLMGVISSADFGVAISFTGCAVFALGVLNGVAAFFGALRK
jgi:hypothetical protein